VDKLCGGEAERVEDATRAAFSSVVDNGPISWLCFRACLHRSIVVVASQHRRCCACLNVILFSVACPTSILMLCMYPA